MVLGTDSKAVDSLKWHLTLSVLSDPPLGDGDRHLNLHFITRHRHPQHKRNYTMALCALVAPSDNACIGTNDVIVKSACAVSTFGRRRPEG